MSDLIRLSISLESSLARRLERLVKASRYTNRSEFVRDMIRERLVEQQWADDNQEVLGTITLLYDHHAGGMANKSVDIQHRHYEQILATTHLHLSHDLCAEMIMVRAPAAIIREIADDLRSRKGVLHGSLSISSTGKSLH